MGSVILFQRLLNAYMLCKKPETTVLNVSKGESENVTINLKSFVQPDTVEKKKCPPSCQICAHCKHIHSVTEIMSVIKLSVGNCSLL